jgi:hypothetical protein
MAYDAALDRDKAIKTIFLRPGNNEIADEFVYGDTDINIYPGMALDLINQTKYSSGNATNKGGYYTPQICNFNYYEGQTVLEEWEAETKVMTRLTKPGDLVAILVSAGTTTNYAVGAYLINEAHVSADDSTGMTFNDGTLVAGTVTHFQVEIAPTEDITTTELIVARCISPVLLSNPV